MSEDGDATRCLDVTSPSGDVESQRGSQYDARSVRSFSTEEWSAWRERFKRDTLRYKSVRMRA